MDRKPLPLKPGLPDARRIPIYIAIYLAAALFIALVLRVSDIPHRMGCGQSSGRVLMCARSLLSPETWERPLTGASGRP
jgi:hypothetical protein